MLARAAVIIAAAAFAPASASACTLCHSDTAERVRVALFAPDLFANALQAFAPAPVLVAAWWLVSARGR